ncbi:asparagine synthase (glutamine-hydrolyzing) [uncultured Psychroserpens sp.]|uniref:asparagine synthase (glutamine-hydrolyzing) n=1 Tax=uncultured Psychroserpens sp. TaxID=255436 RepID=UPI00260DCC0E|nr:asparagine synthase (glutamine-hydrolyzing) [uncultured Psychroserpens sp.]
MCGFLAEFTFGTTSVSEAAHFQNLLSLSKHRGPDATQTEKGSNYQLGFNRLSILDLSPNGNQPKQSPSKRYHVVFNGELYNYKDLEIRYELSNLRSTSDSEVLVHLLDKIGVEQTITELNGMFAITVKDLQTGNIYLIRDFAGIKPLFYGVSSKGIVAASQFDQVFKHMWFKDHLQLRSELVKEYFGFGYMQSPNTIYDTIFQVNPGTFIQINSDQSIEEKQYSVFNDVKPTSRQSDTIVNDLKTKINKAVKRQLMSDVPLATFLSGGIDSPLITAIAKQEHPNIEAFTVSVEDKQLDESDDAMAYAEHINVNHKVEHVKTEELVNLIDEHFSKFPEPFGDYSSIPTYLISKKARETNTVMLSGDGGDELFFGYPRMLDVMHKAHWFKIPFALRRPLIRLTNRLKITNSWAPYHFKTIDEWVKEKHTYIFKDKLNGFFKDQKLSKEMHKLYTVSNHSNTLSWLRYNEFYAHMQRVLIKVDRMSMANSLEVRVPFLDKEVIDTALHYLPENFENEEDLKRPLKLVMETHYPKSLINKQKKGFSVPINSWLRHELKKDVEKVILETPFYGAEIINLQAVKKYIEDFYNNKHESAWGVWHIYAWQKWAISQQLV